ncbi:osmoprotectant transport system substrate-binding protein [Methylocapsa palsarum]|uniref:Osmoprotectant transport system substrate-binding protein n=1 Tax=Methylocapsa palsarum TaxID=1612308 RepID=A0A1I3YMF4_9HYPH|nr:osmoprotectant transport system substrate-binding protein [Methylocapsa palsarum]
MTRRELLICAFAAAAPRTTRAAAPVVVGSKLDLEGGLLGQMILLSLERAGVPTENRLQIGPTAIARAALLSGAIDLSVEYTGNAAFFFHQEDDEIWKDAKGGYIRAAELDATRNGLVWLTPAPADNTWVIAVPAKLAKAASLATLEDFARFVNAGNRVRLAASAEFVESAAGLPAFETIYGFKLRAAQLLILSGGETSATIKAAADGISGVNAAMAYGTDGALESLGLVALGDPRHAEPVYAPTPVVRAAALEDYPQIRAALDPVFAGLDLATLRDLNKKVAIEGLPAREVAQTYLAARGLDHCGHDHCGRDH